MSDVQASLGLTNGAIPAQVHAPEPPPVVEVPAPRVPRNPVETREEGFIRINADSNTVVMGDASLFEHGWKNKSEASAAFVVDIAPDIMKIETAEDVALAREQSDLVAKRIAKSVRREQLVDGTWRVHVLDGVQAGTILQHCNESIKRDDLKVRVEMSHLDETRLRVLDACREKFWGKTTVPGQHKSLELLGFRMKDPLRFVVISDELGPKKIEFFLR